MRCSGSCSHTFHNCIPEETSIKMVSVLLSQRSAVSGPTDTLCATIPVVQHDTCTCGCDVTPAQCTSRQFFLSTECRCTCSDSDARDACLARNWFWNPDLCQCMCPNRPYPTCPTGYIFDHEAACSCRPLAYRAFTVLELVVVVIALGTLCTTLSLVQCYRRGLGLFKHRREVRYRTESFRGRLKSLSERMTKRREEAEQEEELVHLKSLSPQNSSNASPDRTLISPERNKNSPERNIISPDRNLLSPDTTLLAEAKVES